MEFLFDDTWIDRAAGVRRVLGRPVKEDGFVLAPETPWEAGGIHGCCGPLYDEQEGKFKMWYHANSASDDGEPDRAAPRFACYAESTDGLTWTRPDLGLVAFAGNNRNNIIREITGDSVFWNVVKDNDDPDPGRRYKALGFDPCHTASLIDGVKPGTKGVAVGFSPDGIHWDEGCTLVMRTQDLTDADCILPHREPTTGKWVAFFRPRTTPKRRYLGYSESDDFVHWNYPRMLLTPDSGDSEWVEFYGLAATAIDEWRVGVLWVYHNHPASSPMSNELVYSRHGLEYGRALPRHEFLPLGADGKFDSRRAWPTAMIGRGNEILIYYNAGNTEHGSDRTPSGRMSEQRTCGGEPRRNGLSLARLPWGHFCGLRADLDGQVETKWLTNYGPRGVEVTAEVAEGGHLGVELLDIYGRPVPGWGPAESHLSPRDDGRIAVHWGADGLDGRFGQVSSEGGRADHVLKLCFHLRRATLFGFQIGDPGSGPEYSA